jgi:hypothetical protein
MGVRVDDNPVFVALYFGGYSLAVRFYFDEVRKFLVSRNGRVEGERDVVGSRDLIVADVDSPDLWAVGGFESEFDWFGQVPPSGAVILRTVSSKVLLRANGFLNITVTAASLLLAVMGILRRSSPDVCASSMPSNDLTFLLKMSTICLGAS